MNQYKNIPKHELNEIVFPTGIIKTPFHEQIPVIYADYTASGRPSPYIERKIQTDIFPYYSNTHSNAHNGIYMKQLIETTKQKIREHTNTTRDHKILFLGSGTTTAMNHLVELIDYSRFSKVVVFLSYYEHYSNHIPWLEVEKKYPRRIKIMYIPFKREQIGVLDLNFIKNEIEKIPTLKRDTLIICSVSVASNITGILQPIRELRVLLDSFKKPRFETLLFCDYAASAPYLKIDGSFIDAFAFSGHKFIGGIETPGVLVARNKLFMKNRPVCSGGGCVKSFQSNTNYTFEDDIERREMAGTPNIVGIIKLNYVLMLKDKYLTITQHNDNLINHFIREKVREFSHKYPSQFNAVLYNENAEHIPILSFSIQNLHYNFVVVLLNDMFGIQSRGGISCCGLIGKYMSEEHNIKGWCRISFHWLMNSKTIYSIFDAIEYVIVNGVQYMRFYEYDKNRNLYIFKPKVVS